MSQLIQEFPIRRQLEGATQVRFEIVQLPQAVHRTRADLLRLRHESAAPMGHPRGLTVQGRLDDPLARGLIVLRLAPPPRGGLPNLPPALLAHPPAAQHPRGAASHPPLANCPTLV